jgi:hypothetical protein
LDEAAGAPPSWTASGVVPGIYTAAVVLAGITTLKIKRF